MSNLFPPSKRQLLAIAEERPLNGSEEQSLRIWENLEDADFEEMSFSELEDLFEDRDPFEFL
jgi:hypothetical protein